MPRFIAYILMVLAVGTAFSAVKKNTDPNVALEKARAAFSEYDPETAREMYDEYAALLKKKKQSVPEDVEAEIARLVLMENMLSRVERITIIDSLVVDADGFFRHYKLSPEAGRLVGGEAVRMADVEVAFIPQNNTEFLYAEPDSDGNFVLMGADILDDGMVDRPAPLRGEDLAGGGNAEYPFLMSDGMTLYFANDGEESLGGYDIFLTRRNDDGTYLQPQNIGMPYNSPYDDYMLAIDESTGAGWWATDRNQIPEKLTIYVFVPSDTRVNVDEDDPNLVALARIDDISLTQQVKRLDQVKAKIDAIDISGTNGPKDIPTFELAVGKADRIYHSLDDFHSKSARQAMVLALNARTEVQRTEARLTELREQWRNGNQSHGITILNLEQQLAEARERMKKATNRAIEEELKTVR